MSIYRIAELLREKLEMQDKNPLKIALFGQPGSGKSSIINRLVGYKVVQTGVATDKTLQAQVIHWNHLLLVDLPGYGTSKFPANDFFDKFDIKSFDLYLCVFSGKFHQVDTDFFYELRSNGKICLFIRNFHDIIWDEGKTVIELEQEIIEDTCQQTRSREHVYFTSCRTGKGINELSEAIYNHIDETQKAKWLISAKAYSAEFLDKKKEECKKYVYMASGAAALNGLNPLPGVDIGIDVSIIIGIFTFLRKSYGLNDDKLKSKEYTVPTLAPLVNNVLKYSAKEGVNTLLKRFLSSEAVKEVSKYIPFVGQAIAATIGYGITRSACIYYLQECHSLAKAMLDEELKNSK